MLYIIILAITLIRIFLLRVSINESFELFPPSNTLNYSFLDDIYRNGLPAGVWGWGNFDGNHYIGIAMRGYGGFEHPFFPLYPFLIKFVADLGLRPLFAAEIISLGCFLVAVYFLLKILEIDNHSKLIWTFLGVLLLFPTSFYFTAAYNDSIFLLLSTLTIFFARKKHWVIAAGTACLATLARLNGLALAVFLVAEYFSGNSWNLKFLSNINFRKIFTSGIFFVILIPLAFLGYLGYVQTHYGSWTLVFSDMQLWHQEKVILPTQVLWRYFKILVLYVNLTPAYFTAILELLFVIGYIFMLVIFWTKIRLSYWVLFFVSILIPALTGTFQGMPRYGLHIYPFFLMLAVLIHSWRKEYKALYFISSTLILLVLASLFVHGYFIA